MTTGRVGLAGQRPRVKIRPVDPNKPSVKKVLTEKEKYTKMWTVEEYRKVAPGELAANTFLSIAKPNTNDEIIDFGCGTGRGSFYLCFLGGMNVTAVDFASNCLDSDVQLAMKNFPDRIRFVEQDLNNKLDMCVKYGYCTDVMEHIPEAEVDNVLDNILDTARHVFFRISTVPDIMGPKCLRQPLHLTVKDYQWWTKKLLKHGVVILHSEDLGGAVDFYVTGWSDELPKDPKLNTDKEKILSNIKENAVFGCKHVRPHRVQENAEIMLLCGGPSLNDFEDEIIQNWKNGMKVVTMNGTYKWCMDRGITNVNHCMIDARPFNKRFIEPVRNDCYYFIATQCDPSVFAMLPPERTFFWQCTGSPEAIETVCEYYPEYIISSGGSTVALRAILLMRVLGFRKQIIYGMDSCLINGEHHAYEQKENDAKDATAMPVSLGDRIFKCHPWMTYQAFEFIDMVKKLGDEFTLDVKGDGLIANILKTGAELPIELEDN